MQTKRELVMLNGVPGESEYREGVEFYKKCQYKAAEASFTASMNKDYPAAYLFLGMMYKNGYGVIKDEVKSKAWFQKAVISIDWFRKAAEKAHPDAQRNLGILLAHAQGVEKNEKMAVHYYELAAEQGDVIAQVYLGLCYRTGRGVEKNEKLALKYFQLAAGQGDAAAKTNLRILLEQLPYLRYQQTTPPQTDFFSIPSNSSFSNITTKSQHTYGVPEKKFQ